MKIACSILIFTVSAALRAEPDGTPQVVKNDGVSKMDEASIVLWSMGCYNTDLDKFSKCIAEECNEHLKGNGYQAIVFAGNLGPFT